MEAIFKQYGGDELEVFLELKSRITNLLIDQIKDLENMSDHLGKIYMELISKSKQKDTAQVFTPIHVAELMTGMTLNMNEFKEKAIVSINDPCVGAGVFMIAACKFLNSKKINYTSRLLIVCNDIDLICVYMTYVQLSFIGASAVVEHKNTITQEKWDEFRTLGVLLNPAMIKNFGH